jgi:choline transport protein
VTLIYGIIIIFVLAGSCALSMAEIASVYPTAGGQYHWTSILAPEGINRPLVSTLLYLLLCLAI